MCYLSVCWIASEGAALKHQTKQYHTSQAEAAEMLVRNALSSDLPWQHTPTTHDEYNLTGELQQCDL